MAEHKRAEQDPGRARRLALLAQVESNLTELFVHAESMPEPQRAVARAFLHDLVARCASGSLPAFQRAPEASTAPRSSTQRTAPRLVVTGPANPNGAKGPPCDRCGGAGVWRGGKGGSGPCFACN